MEITMPNPAFVCRFLHFHADSCNLCRIRCRLPCEQSYGPKLGASCCRRRVFDRCCPESRIESVLTEELAMRALLGEPALVQHQNAVHPVQRGDAMRDEENRPVRKDCAEIPEYFSFGRNIQGRSGFVQDQ